MSIEDHNIPSTYTLPGGSKRERRGTYVTIGAVFEKTLVDFVGEEELRKVAKE
jgi:hypothetical protein